MGNVCLHWEFRSAYEVLSVFIYDASTDWLPIYDKACLPGIYMACRTSGNQYKNVPIAGNLMASLVEYYEAGNDHDASLLSFDSPYIGHKVDAVFYSRKKIEPRRWLIELPMNWPSSAFNASPRGASK